MEKEWQTVYTLIRLLWVYTVCGTWNGYFSVLNHLGWCKENILSSLPLFSGWYVCLFWFRFQQFFSHITTVSDCDWDLNAHFYSAASLKYHAPDTCHESTPSHIILTLGRPVLALPESLRAKHGAASTIFNDFGTSQDRTVTSCPPNRTLYWLSFRGWWMICDLIWKKLCTVKSEKWDTKNNFYTTLIYNKQYLGS